MEYIARDLTELVGHTPLLEASRFCAARGLCCRLLCKLESLNPAGSVKDRVALAREIPASGWRPWGRCWATESSSPCRRP